MAEARLFSKLCEYVWSLPGTLLILPPENSALWKPNTSEMALLSDVGLTTYATTPFTFKAGELPVVNAYIGSHTYQLRPNSNTAELRLGQLILTQAGKEMWRLTTPNPPQSYIDEVVSEWRKLGVVTYTG